MKTVYADIVFCLNFIADFTLLYISAYSLNIKVKQTRIIASAIVGGIYGVICAVLSLKSFALEILDILILLLMCFVAYYGVTLKAYLRLIINMLCYSFILCGFVSLEPLRRGRPFVVIAVSCVMFIVFVRKNVFLFRKRRFERTVNALLCKDGKEISVCLLIDSGNLLADYITGLPVMIVLDKAVHNLEPKITRYIRFKTVNGEGMLGVAEDVEVYIKAKNKRIKIRTIVGIHDVSEEKTQQFDGILPAELAENIF